MMGGNLYAANPDTAWADRALGRIGFKLFLTTTLNRGHVCGVDGGESLILPVTARDEEWEPTTQESMFNYVRLSDGGIRRLAGVRPEAVILCDLASRLLEDCPVDFQVFKHHRRIRDAIAAMVPGMEALQDIDVARREFHIRGRILHAPEFATADGRARFIVEPIPAEPRGSVQGERMYTLTTVRSEGQFNSIVYEYQDSYRQNGDRWVVMMNEADMAARGIRAGERVTVASAQGCMADVRVRPYPLPRGDVMAYYPEANVLTSTAVDPASRTPGFKATPVTIRRSVAQGPPVPAHPSRAVQ